MIADDLPRVAELCDQLGYPVAGSDLAGRYSELERSGDGLFVAVGDAGGVCGWIHVAVDRALTHGASCEIKGLVIDRTERGRGFGRKLVRAAEAWSAEQSCRTVRVRSRTSREDAARFYRACGYEVSKTQNVFVRELG